MRDLVVREGLGAMAFDAAERLRALVDAGEEIPYEVHESGDGSPLCRYQPLTERFVRDHANELRELDSFGSAAATLEATGLAQTYLEEMGIGVPSDPRTRAELAGVAFLCRLWMDSSDFSFEQDRLEAAIAEVEAGGELPVGEIEVIVPVRGLQLPISRLELATATLVRADTVEVPAEAQSGDLGGASPWEPAFLAVARIPDPSFSEDDTDAGALAVESFRKLITTLRLFKAGGVGLGPHAWTRISGDRWRRIATGAGRPRPGGYRLSEAELGGLVALSSALAGPSTPYGRGGARRPGFPSALVRAMSRFEAGLERNVVIEALNDHLLCLRFILEGGGPADLGLPMRVAALCAEPGERDEVKAVVDRAIGLERELWSGEPAPSSGALTPAETALRLEELARAILKDAACGHLGNDLRSTADEILLADGLAVGEGDAEQRGETAEWSAGSELAEEIEAQAVNVEVGPSEPELIDELDRLDEAMKGSPLDARITPEPGEPAEEEQMSLAPEMKRRIELAAEETRVLPLAALPDAPEAPIEPQAASREPERQRQPERASAQPELPVDASGRGPSPVLELIAQTRAEREARQDRVSDLFPRPETTEWNVREIAYDRRRRAEVHQAS